MRRDDSKHHWHEVVQSKDSGVLFAVYFNVRLEGGQIVYTFCVHSITCLIAAELLRYSLFSAIIEHKSLLPVCIFFNESAACSYETQGAGIKPMQV